MTFERGSLISNYLTISLCRCEKIDRCAGVNECDSGQERIVGWLRPAELVCVIEHAVKNKNHEFIVLSGRGKWRFSTRSISFLKRIS